MKPAHTALASLILALSGAGAMGATLYLETSPDINSYKFWEQDANGNRVESTTSCFYFGTGMTGSGNLDIRDSFAQGLQNFDGLDAKYDSGNRISWGEGAGNSFSFVSGSMSDAMKEMPVLLFFGNGADVGGSTQFSIISFKNTVTGYQLTWGDIPAGDDLFQLALISQGDMSADYGLSYYAEVLVGSKLAEGGGVSFVNVSGGAIPESSTVSLGLLGLGALMCRRRRSGAN